MPKTVGDVKRENRSSLRREQFLLDVAKLLLRYDDLFPAEQLDALRTRIMPK